MMLLIGPNSTSSIPWSLSPSVSCSGFTMTLRCLAMPVLSSWSSVEPSRRGFVVLAVLRRTLDPIRSRDLLFQSIHA